LTTAERGEQLVAARSDAIVVNGDLLDILVFAIKRVIQTPDVGAIGTAGAHAGAVGAGDEIAWGLSGRGQNSLPGPP